MASKKVVAEVQLSEGLLDTIHNLARRLQVSDEDVLASSVKLMDGVQNGDFKVIKINGKDAKAAEPAK